MDMEAVRKRLMELNRQRRHTADDDWCLAAEIIALEVELGGGFHVGYVRSSLSYALLPVLSRQEAAEIDEEDQRA